MAERLARLYGTEQDNVNCAFFAKMGACRYGIHCKKNHHRPGFSPCLQMDHMYKNPVAAAEGTNVTIPKEVAQAHFDEFFEDVYHEMSNFGKIEQLNICANLGEHMVGNVYVLYDDEEASAKALASLNGRFYAGAPLVPEISPVTDFHEARCRAYDESECGRGGQCNFMHIMRPSEPVMKKLGIRSMDHRRPRRSWSPQGRNQAGKGGGRDERGGKDDRRDRRRSRSKDRRRSRSRSKDRRRDSRRDSRRSRSRGKKDKEEKTEEKKDTDEGLMQF